MKVGVVAESFPGERRVALVPGPLSVLKKSGVEFLMEPGAGQRAGFADREYAEKGAAILNTRGEVFAASDILLQVRTPGANPETGAADVGNMRRGQTVIGFAE